ncbi:MAG: glycosyltransferase [Acidobacteriota bacterium]
MTKKQARRQKSRTAVAAHESSSAALDTRLEEAVAIAGMHRSGTSMVTKLLHEGGLYLGPAEDIAPAKEDNPDGFWENLRLVEINEEILGELGGAWDFPSPLPESWRSEEKFLQLRAKAEMVLAPLRKHSRWGWKDPRNSLTIPFWSSLVPDLKVVVCVRNPLEVALSLHRRNYLSYEMGLTLWTIYNQRLLESTTPEQRLVAHYDAFFDAPANELRRLVDFAGLQLDSTAVDGLASTVRRELRHHRFTARHLVEIEVSNHLLGLYGQLCDEAKWLDRNGTSRSEFASAAALREYIGGQPLNPEMRLLHSGEVQRPSTAPVAVGRINRVALERELLERELLVARPELSSRQRQIEELSAIVHRLTADDRVAEADARQNEALLLREESDRVRRHAASLEEQAARVPVLERTWQQQQSRILNLESELTQLAEQLDLTRRQRDWHSQDRDDVLRVAEEHGRARFALEGELAGARNEIERRDREAEEQERASVERQESLPAETSRPADESVLRRFSGKQRSRLRKLSVSWWSLLNTREAAAAIESHPILQQPDDEPSLAEDQQDILAVIERDATESEGEMQATDDAVANAETPEAELTVPVTAMSESELKDIQEIRQFSRVFQRRFGRIPAILDWDSALGSIVELPEAAMFSPPLADGIRLPYVDSSVDAVIVRQGSVREREAARVAQSALLVRKKNGDALVVRWLERPEEDSFPAVSIIIPVHNHLELTRECLEAVRLTLPETFRGEIIIVDDASTDGTHGYLEQLLASDSRFRSVRNETNAGFLDSVNRGASVANGEIFVFLNNDTLPRPGWIDAIVDTFRNYPDCGAVGGKLLFPDGRLQEAGGVIFADASGLNFGRNGDASRPLYSFVRDVDYCSGAILATRADLWNEIGGFDTRFRPAYYEDADYCFTVRSRGRRVLYQPACEIVHLEGGTGGVDITSGAKRAQMVNRSRFAVKWESELKHQFNPPDVIDVPAELRVLFPADRKRILVINHTVPEYDRESGSKRLFDILGFLVEDGWAVSFMAGWVPGGERYVRELQQMGIATFEKGFLPLNDPAYEHEAHRLIVNGCFDAALICFWHIAEHWTPLIRTVSPRTRIIVDSVDLHFLRTVRSALRPDKSEGTRELLADDGAAFRQELNAYAAADRVLTVSEKEAAILNDFLSSPDLAVAVPDIEELDDSPFTFEERRGILFIGSFRHPPNCEAAEYLLRQILPLVDSHLLEAHPLRIVGTDLPEEIISLARSHGNVEVVGWVPSIGPYLDRTRISVLPLLSGAGTKRKFIQSAMTGTPAVATTIAAEGLQFAHGRDTLIADTPAAFARSIEELLSNEQTWSRLSANSRDVVLRTHGRNFGRSRLLEALSSNPGPDAASTVPYASEERRADEIAWLCNICGTTNRNVLAELADREKPNCRCGSTVRFRAIVSVLSRELFGRSLLLREFPFRPDIRGVGMSDWEGYAERLRDVVSYENRFLHMEPRLDITAIEPSLRGQYDFIISSEVFEHVAPPVSRAFENARELLKPGGFLLLTVPYLDDDGVETVEHFPSLHDFEILGQGSDARIANRTPDGRMEEFRNLVFHGGPGLAVEMRLFSKQGLLAEFAAAGLQARICGSADVDHGVWFSNSKSLPIIARRSS